MQSVLGKDLLIKCLHTYCKLSPDISVRRAVVLISWEGERDTSGQREGGEGAGEREACGRSSLNTGALSRFPSRSDQQRCTLSSSLTCQWVPRGFRHGWIQVLRQCGRTLLHLRSLLFPRLPSPSHWASKVKHSDWPGLGHSLDPPLDSVSREHLAWGPGGGRISQKKTRVFLPED